MEYHGVVIDNSLEDPSLLATVTTLALKPVTSSDNSPWYLRLISIRNQQLDAFLSLASDIIKPGWYLHCYNDRELVVVFKDKVLRFNLQDRSRWQAAIRYGKSTGIRLEQLDFWPHRTQQEQAWLTAAS